MCVNNFLACSPAPRMTTLRENTRLSANPPTTRAATRRDNIVAVQVPIAKLTIQTREYSMEIFSENAAANRKRNVVAKAITILSANDSGRMAGSNW
jgi:hypothetical protein